MGRMGGLWRYLSTWISLTFVLMVFSQNDSKSKEYIELTVTAVPVESRWLEE